MPFFEDFDDPSRCGKSCASAGAGMEADTVIIKRPNQGDSFYILIAARSRHAS